MNIDKWCAEQCGVKETTTNSDSVLYSETEAWFHNGVWRNNDKWTIEDPRCREIVREHFFIDTLTVAEPFRTNDGNKWNTYCFKPSATGSYCVSATGKTIAEAEIECINAIYNQLGKMSEQPE